MILSTLRELAHREKLLEHADYEPKPVAWIITVADGGKFVNLTRTVGESTSGTRKSKAKTLDIPRRKGRTAQATADFLVDKSEYVLAIEPEGKRSSKDLSLRLELFREEIAKALAKTELPALAAVHAFLLDAGERNRAAAIVAAESYASNDLFAFEYRGQLVHDLPEIQAYFAHSRRASKQGDAQCLVCGSQGDISRKHPTLPVPGGTTSGVALVSFNADAFESYGMEGNENAPVCQDCADAYTTALKRLLSDRYPNVQHPGEVLPRRFVRLSYDTTAVFWTDEDASIVDMLTSYFDAPRIENVRTLLEAGREGRRPAAVCNRFYCLILSGGQGRAILRGLHTGTVAQVAQNVAAYFDSIEVGADQPPPLIFLMRSLVLQGKLENLPPGLATEVFLAIIFDRHFPKMLLARAVDRCRAERKVTRERAALLRAYMIRNHEMEVSVGLDTIQASPGYRLGRLMAVLERLQAAAQNNLNKNIVDRYYGAASTRPGTVFPRLIALAQHHLAKLPPRSAACYHARLGEVLDGLASFPPTLNLEQQGLFALGYYHQRQEFFKKADSRPAEDDNEKGQAA